jgi:hypothetical protein
MLKLNRTRARSAFKDLLGQANHFLITILVGLNGVREGTAVIEEEFRTSWNPKDVRRSAERARVFALDLSLVRAIDALDTYMIMSARKPCALPDADFIGRMDGTGRSVSKRFKVFTEIIPSLRDSHAAALTIAIEWRNRRVHSLADDLVERAAIGLLLSESEWFMSQYSGLAVKDLITRYRAGDPPTFKEAAGIIRMCHDAVETFDRHLIRGLLIERYLKDSVKLILLADSSDISYSCKRIWDSPKREEKALRLLRLAGVSETESAEGREVPSSFIDTFIGLDSADVQTFLND